MPLLEVSDLQVCLPTAITPTRMDARAPTSSSDATSRP